MVSAFSGTEGLEKALALRPDLILSDVMMPEMSGDQLVYAVRRQPHLDDVPIVLLTAKADDEMRVRLLRAGAQDYIMKPFSAEELRARIANLVQMRRARAVLQRDLSSRSCDLELLANEVTRRRQEAQTALEAANVALEAAERANRLKSRFLAMISHELGTPLGTIRLRLERLARGLKTTLSPPQRNLMSGMVETLDSFVRLFESLLEYARIEGGRLTTKMETFSLEVLAGEIVDGLRPRAEQKGLELRMAVGPSIPRAWSDSRLVRIILANLVANAIKFTKRGGIDLSITHDSEGHRVMVSDTGPGIPTDLQERMFEPFEQLELLSFKHTPGIGLGLALVKEMVSSLGGRIRVESRMGAGSAFSVILPPH